MKLKATIELWQRGKWCIAKIPELDFIAQGKTIEEAKSNLLEVIKIQFAEMKEMGTFEDYLAECGFTVKDDTILPENEMIGFEKQMLQVV
jgi:predicted RNase H-like HicB family nuclease